MIVNSFDSTKTYLTLRCRDLLQLLQKQNICIRRRAIAFTLCMQDHDHLQCDIMYPIAGRKRSKEDRNE